jgi:hypothetical protein
MMMTMAMTGTFGVESEERRELGAPHSDNIWTSSKGREGKDLPKNCQWIETVSNPDERLTSLISAGYARLIHVKDQIY